MDSESQAYIKEHDIQQDCCLGSETQKAVEKIFHNETLLKKPTNVIKVWLVCYWWGITLNLAMCIFPIIFIVWIHAIMHAYSDVIYSNIFQIFYSECHKHIKSVNSFHVMNAEY